MRRALVLAAVLLWVLPQAPAAGRVLVISFDGLGQQRLTEDPVARELVTVRRLLTTGAHADGLVPAYPSTTANSHAALWTGTYAGRNGILYNTTPILPRATHTFRERVVGFRSEALTAEPIWLTAARQGVPTVAYQVTQAYPFLPQTVGVNTQGLTVVNGFQSAVLSPWRVVHASDAGVRPVPCDAWREPSLDADTCFEWPVDSQGRLTVRAAARGDRLLLSFAPERSYVEALRHGVEGGAPRTRPLARYWSRPLLASDAQGPFAAIVFRLLEVDARRGTFTLVQSPARETAAFDEDPELARALVEATGPMVGNGADELYESGRLGLQAYAGGTGVAERLYLETLEVVVRQHIVQSAWLWNRRAPRLHVSYLAALDEIDHLWYGLDAAGDGRYRTFRRWGYAAAEHAARAFVGLAGPDDHVVVTSDHGMAAQRIAFDVPAALAAAGLERTASALSACIVLNTTDWKDGIVAPGARASALARVVRMLNDARTAQGERVVTRIYSTPEEMAFFGHDGPAGADLCMDLRPGIGFGSAAGAGVVRQISPPRGTHGLDPTRDDMKAVLLVRGPRVAAGASLGRQRSGVVAPLVADLLGIDKPQHSTFESPLVEGGAVAGGQVRSDVGVVDFYARADSTGSIPVRVTSLRSPLHP